LRVCSGLLGVSGFSECLHGFFECLRSHEPFQHRTQRVGLFVCAYRAPTLNFVFFVEYLPEIPSCFTKQLKTFDFAGTWESVTSWYKLFECAIFKIF